MNGSIEEIIKSKKDKKQIEILSKFLKKFQDCSENIYVTEYKLYYEIIVNRKSLSEDRTGGAEQYILDKKTGEWKMGWHEHPMKREKYKVQPEE